MPIFIVVGTGLLGTIAVLAISMRIGRDEPHHRVPWIIALVALGLDSAIHIAISVGALTMGGWDEAWIAVGSLAIAGVFATAWIQPRIAGLWLIVTAIVLPLLFLALSAVWSPTEETVPVGVLLAFYPPRMLIVGALLVWSARPTREHADNTQKEESPASTG